MSATTTQTAIVTLTTTMSPAVSEPVTTATTLIVITRAPMARMHMTTTIVGVTEEQLLEASLDLSSVSAAWSGASESAAAQDKEQSL